LKIFGKIEKDKERDAERAGEDNMSVELKLKTLTAGEIAKAAGLSPTYLSRKFRQATGTGVHEYLTFLRLKEAALELLSTDSSVTEIALRCGFSDGNYFKDVFKKRYGVTPTGYRKSRPGERDRKRGERYDI
jgi:AraC-like DNA-binding protein